MTSLLDALESWHKSIGSVAGEICIALTIRRVPGGVRAMKRWARDLRAMADEIEAAAERLEERKKAIGR
jgi:hypothetical protein